MSRTVSVDLFGNALGHWLSESPGLRAVYLPSGVRRPLASSIVNAANEARPSVGEAGTTYCLLIDSESAAVEDGLSTISASDSVQYRQDERLLVVVGREPELASVRGSYKTLLDKSFPAGLSSESLANLAAHIVRVVLAAANIRAVASPSAVEVLTLTLEDTRVAHEATHQGSKPWNAYWFDHVSIALTNLRAALEKQKDESPHSDIGELLVSVIPASFAFPQRGLGSPSAVAFNGRRFKDALEKSWSDEESVKTSVRLLANHPDTDGDEHSLAAIDWEGFDTTLAAEDNVLIALAKHSTDFGLTTSAFAGLTYKQFLDPSGAVSAPANLRVFTGDGSGDRGCSISETPEDGPDLVPLVLIFEAGKPSKLESPLLRIRIPTNASVEEQLVAESRADVSLSQKTMNWNGNLQLEEGILWAVGRISQAIKRLPHTIPSRPLTLRISAKSSDSLAGYLYPDVTRQVLLSVEEIPGMWIQRLGASAQSVGRPEYVGPESINKNGLTDQSTASWSTDYENSDHRLIMWGAAEGPGMPTGTPPASTLFDNPAYFTSVLKISDLDEIEIGSFLFELRAAESSATDFSPIVAAVNKNRISTDAATTGMSSSLAAKYEQLLIDSLQNEEFLRGHGHIVLPTDRESMSVSEAVWSEAHQVWMPPRLESSWAAVFGGEVGADLRNSDEARAFRQSFIDLGIESALFIQNNDGEPHRRWPSRASWRHLWEQRRGQLDGYLETYSALVEKARELDDPFGVLWAAFPFSMSGWTTRASAQCKAIYLSPLHPLRLAWLAGVEETVFSAVNARDLAGQIEGWNFPSAGPCGMPQGFSLAVPCDPGDHQLFMGWSLLVKAELQVPHPLQAPRKFGRDDLPGNAASGLNATSTAAALRDFHRMQPHISTLTVDLASSVETQRLPEIDAAIVKVAEKWTTKDNIKLPGGIRVLDSQNRVGDLPRQAVAQLLERNDGVPFSWRRYQHEAGDTQRCNIRFLQDSGVAVYAEEAGRRNRERRGLTAEVPLRRFELLDEESESRGQSLSTPGIRLEQCSTTFARALSVVEGPSGGPSITGRIQNALLVDSRADWTVSGEAMIAPSALSAMVQQHGSGDQMLWEWRPPFLGFDRQVPPLSRRPFISIAKVPDSFATHLQGTLSSAQDRAVAKPEVADLLATLGARGIGLSSLLSRGGTHATGALGFYLTLRLLDHVSQGTSNDFVLPIDACDSFLRSLAGETTSTSNEKKADLLAVRLTDDEVILVPIEIKFRGANGIPDSSLPAPSSSKLKDATRQLGSTRKVLQKLVERHSAACSDSNSADSALWSNTLGTLVETGMKLSPGPGGDLGSLATRFHSIMSGTHRLRIGKPLVAYFSQGTAPGTHASHASYSGVMTSHGAKDNFEIGVYTSNAQAAFRAVKDGDISLISAWAELVEWAFSMEGGQSGPETEPDLPDDAPTSSSTLPAHGPEGDVSNSGRNIPKGEENIGGSSSHSLAASGGELRGSGIRFTVGKLLNSAGTANADFWPSNTGLNQMNIGVVGDLGTGKTQLLKALVLQLRSHAESSNNPPLSMLIFDYKKDFQQADFLQSVGGTVLTPHQIPLNLFSIEGNYTRQKAYRSASRFGDVVSKIYSGIGPKQRQRLNDVVVDLFEQFEGRPPTIGSVYDAYVALSPSPDALSAILQSFYYNEVFSEVNDDLVSFDDLINDRVLVLAVDSFGTDQKMKNSLVTLFLNMYYDYMLRATKWPYLGSNPQLRKLNSFLLIDEAVNILEYKFPVLQQLLLQGREYGFGIILSTQYLSHFKQGDTNYGEPLRTWFIHKVPSIRHTELHQLGLTEVSEGIAVQIPNLKQHQALYISLGFNGRFIDGIPYYQLVNEHV